MGVGNERKITIANDTKVFLSGWQKIYIISLSMQDVTAASVESKKASGENKKASGGKSRGGYRTKLFYLCIPLDTSLNGRKGQRIKFNRTHYIK